MGKIQSPTKLARKELRSMGARFDGRHRESEHYLFPDGNRYTLRAGNSFAKITADLHRLRERYGWPADTYTHGVQKTGAPVMDIARLKVTKHAQDRWAQMCGQARLEMSELTLTLRAPTCVRWSPTHESWVWVRDRLAVSVIEKDGRLLVKTVLWATAELWEAHPRRPAHG